MATYSIESHFLGDPADQYGARCLPHYEMQGNHDTSMDTRFFREKLWYIYRSNEKRTAPARGAVLLWPARQDSNLRPSESESGTLSS